MATPKKKTNKTASLSADEEPSLSKIEQTNVNHLFAQALLRYKHDTALDKKVKLKEISHLSLIAEEYLSCFALIGYSLQDEQVVIFNMPTPKDEAALIDLLRSTFLDLAGDRP